MMEVYVLNSDLTTIGIIDNYKSLIWSNRYQDIGDAELYISADAEILNLLKIGFYLLRTDDSMIVRIKKIELQTDAEDGNYLVVEAYDAKDILDQRIIYETHICKGNVEDFARELVTDCLISPTNARRSVRKSDRTLLLQLGEKSNLEETAKEQVTYKNLGEKIREYCKTYGWGYRVSLTNNQLSFSLYCGSDRTSTVVFSDNFENLSATNYTEDLTNLGNVSLVGGEGEGSERVRVEAGEADGIERYEIFTDADDISKNISYSDLKKTFPLSSATIVQEGTKYFYIFDVVDVPIFTTFQEALLRDEYPDGTLIENSEGRFWRVTNIAIAELPSASPEDNDTVTLQDIIYEQYLMQRGYEKLAEYGAVTSFEGSIIPDVTFIYKQDYFLGDIVTVENNFGISVQARIVEVVEVWDDSGYSVEPKFEYLWG